MNLEQTTLCPGSATMTDQELDLKAQPALPEHWSLYLRCTICFGYFREPHTLACGHTFCRRCLKRLAEIAKDDNPDVRLRRLSLSCPECRHPFPAKPVFSERVSTCIVLKHLVDLWRRECLLLASSSSLTVRSICTQTQDATPAIETQTAPESAETEKEHPQKALTLGLDEDLQEEFSVRMRPLDSYCEAVMQRVSESTEDLEHDLLQEAIFSKGRDLGSGSILSGLGPAHHLAVAIIGAHHHHYRHHHANGNSDSSSDSDASSTNSVVRRGAGRDRGDAGRGSDNEISSLSSASIPDIFARVNLMPQLGDFAPARLLLLLVWCMYSVVIVGLAQTFLPYVIIFTLFFFLVVLR